MMAARSGWVRWSALLGFLSVAACEKPPQAEDEAVADPLRVVLARVGDDVVTVEDLGWVPAREKTSNRLETLVMRKLAAQEARRRGLAEDPKTRAKLAEFRYSALTWEEKLLRNALYNSIRTSLSFSEPELRAYYEANRRHYIQPQWKLLVRRFPNEAEARAALGESGRLVPAQSEVYGPAPAPEFPADLAAVLGQLAKPGDRVVVQRPGGWSLVELDAYLPSDPVAFDMVRFEVEQGLAAVRAEEMLNAELARLRTEKVVIDQAALAVVERQKEEEVAAVRARREAAAAQGQPAPPEATP